MDKSFFFFFQLTDANDIHSRFFRLLFTFLLFYRATPFANGASDNPDGILKRIGEGNLKMDSGNWLSVSSEAKVNR